MRRGLYAFAFAGCMVALGSIVACEDDDRYVYTGRRFDEANACLGPYVPVERVVGKGADVKCAPVCLTFKDALYVSPVCPPIPVEATELAEDDPRCVAAIEAFDSDTTCGAAGDGDGGEEEEGDAGEDAPAEEDAAEET
jgi:hypothetical protein